jgi:aspartate kinase
MSLKVVKFGGSSLADAGQFAKVREIIRADAGRRFVVPSAPGKRSGDDEKVTDMLYALHDCVVQKKDHQDVFGKIRKRFEEIVRELQVPLDLTDVFAEMETEIFRYDTPDYAASRGEHINGRIMAAYLGVPFVDAAEVIRFNDVGQLDAEETNRLLEEKLGAMENAVVPGFYGAKEDGRVVTFSRGGSDVSGALVARGVSADVYENWTDVSGFMKADPRIVPEAKTIDIVTYNELRELSYMGATVLHEDAVYPVRLADIPIHIKNTNDPKAQGTVIVGRLSEEEEKARKGGAVTGIAGRKGFTIITLEKGMMHNEIGFGRRALEVLEKHRVSVEHIPTGIDTLSLVIDDKYLSNTGKLVVELTDVCAPDSIEVTCDIAMIATVGQGMISAKGTAAKLFSSLAEADINIRMIDQGSSEMNIIVGVESVDFDNAVRAIYKAFDE